MATGCSLSWAKENFLQQRSLTRARDVRDQLEKLYDRIIGKPSSCGAHLEKVKRALTAGFFLNAARIRRSGQGYQTLKSSQDVFIHPSSVIYSYNPPPKLIIYHELVLTTKEFARCVLPIEGKWLAEFAPHVYKKEILEALERRKLPKQRK